MTDGHCDDDARRMLHGDRTQLYRSEPVVFADIGGRAHRVEDIPKIRQPPPQDISRRHQYNRSSAIRMI